MNQIKVILTGHTRGLGASIAEQLLARGVHVLALSRKTHPTLAASAPGHFEQIALDLGDTAALAAWIASERLSRFAEGASQIVLINNAGTVQPIGPLETQSCESIAGAVSLNVTAPLMLSAALMAATSTPAFAQTDRRIMHISSGAGRNATAGWSVYCATKAALDHHARAVALDQTLPLRIASVAPGVVDTDMQGEIRSTGVEKFPALGRFEALKREGKLVTAADTAQKLLDYLFSAEFGESVIADVRELSTK
ncbi:SDR family oxidoreductase [Robbsia sp. KACC 23696]|uniref:SDR family oxidoreductase n=1 Tax=Robbsia sp. KACC 23696 TaxID=3149231 RepID=UPI00325B30F2